MCPCYTWTPARNLPQFGRSASAAGHRCRGSGERRRAACGCRSGGPGVAAPASERHELSNPGPAIEMHDHRSLPCSRSPNGKTHACRPSAKRCSETVTASGGQALDGERQMRCDSRLTLTHRLRVGALDGVDERRSGRQRCADRDRGGRRTAQGARGGRHDASILPSSPSEAITRDISPHRPAISSSWDVRRG